MDQLAYFLGIFPKLSETFVLNELIALEQVGIKPQLFAMYFPEEKVSHEEAQRLAATTTYLPAYVESWGWKLLLIHLSFLLGSPLKYLRALSFVLRKGCARKLLFYYLPVARLMKQRGIKHIHVHFALEQASLAVLINILTGIRYSLTVHAHDLFLPQDLMNDKLERASFIVTCTRFNREFMLEKYPQIEPEKVNVIYHGLNLSEIDRNRDPVIKSEPPVILTIARLVEKKGLTYLLKAAALLRERGREFEVYLVGKGEYLERLEKEARQLQLEHTVHFLGPREHQEVLDFYRKSTLFVLPCIQSAAGDLDGIPNVLVEAMASDLPVVSTRLSGIPELIDNGVSGILVQPKQVEALAQAIEELFADPEKRLALAQAARERVQTLFDCQTAAQKLNTLFRERSLCVAYVA